MSEAKHCVDRCSTATARNSSATSESRSRPQINRSATSLLGHRSPRHNGPR
jgi:hypothetical protein